MSFEKTHIKKVNVDFFIEGLKLNPKAISELLNLQADEIKVKGDDIVNQHGKYIGKETKCIWKISSLSRLSKRHNNKDINAHFEVLLDLLIPRKEKLVKYVDLYEAHFDVLWESSYLYAGTGPVINAKNLWGIAQLDADLAFDIYQIDE